MFLYQNPEETHEKAPNFLHNQNMDSQGHWDHRYSSLLSMVFFHPLEKPGTLNLRKSLLRRPPAWTAETSGVFPQEWDLELLRVFHFHYAREICSAQCTGISATDIIELSLSMVSPRNHFLISRLWV